MLTVLTLKKTSRHLLLATIAAAAASVAMMGGDRAAPPSDSAPDSAQVELAADLSQLHYQIVTRSGSSAASCRAATPRVTNAVIAVPSLVDVGNSLLPDLAVELLVLPSPGGTLLVNLNVDRIGLDIPLRSMVEVVVAPEGGNAERLSFGYDGCEAGTPLVFDELITSSSSRLALKTVTVTPMPALTLIGSEFTLQADGSRKESRVVSARMAPMPISIYTSITNTAPEAYLAQVRARQGINVQLLHKQTDDDGATSQVKAEIGSFPGGLDVSISPKTVDFTATDPFEQPLTKPVDLVDLELVTTEPGEPEERLRARLEQVPAKGRLERTSDTAVEVTAPQGAIGAATVSYASIPEGTTTLPALVPVGDQYLVARKIHDLLVAQVRVRDLSHAVVDAGDPLKGADPETELQTDKVPTVVEATHRAGLFTIDAAVTSLQELTFVEVTRTALVRVANLPSTARVEFGATTQSFEYTGSASIGLLTADVTSTEPFVDDAKEAHLTVKDFPTGLVGRFDEKGKRFVARVPGGQDGRIGLIELQATSGDDLRLPAGIDGILLEDHDAKYAAFARLTGLKRVEVSWGDTQKADVERAPGRFDVHVHIDDPDTADPATNTPKTDLDLDIVVRDLPGKAFLEYTPSRASECPAAPCPKTPSKLKFTGDGPVDSIDLDVVSDQKLIEGGTGNQGATELHGLISKIPAGTLDVVVDGENKKMSSDLNAPAPDFEVELEACSENQCGTPIETLELPAGDPATMDGLWLEDLQNSYHLFGRITGLTDLTLNWSDDVVVKSTKKPGPFDIVVHETKLFDPNSATPIPFGSRTSVAIRELPGTVDLTYAKNTKSLTYNGSAPIGSIEAWLSVDPIMVDSPIDGQEVVNAITGRATEAHALITDLPTSVTLSAAFADEDDETEAASATLNASPGTIGSIYVELTSDESLLDLPAVQAVPVMTTDDGVLSWDLDDGDTNTLEPVEDPYIVVARVNQLRSFHFEKSKPDAQHQVMMAEAERDTRRNIWIDILKPETTKLPRALDGLSQQYQYEYLRMGMDVPPNKLRFDALITRLPNDDFRTLRVTTQAESYANASPDATSMTVETDAGSESLTAYVAPVPAGATYADPGVQACISPARMDCQPEHRIDYAGSEPVSVSLEVAKPIHIDVVRVERVPFVNPNGTIGYRFPEFHVHMDVEKFMQASKEVDFKNVNEYFLFIDTQGHGIQGDITDYTSGGPGGGTDLDIHLSPGTMAEERWVRLEGPPRHSEIIGIPVADGVPMGEMSCANGMDIIIDAFEDIDVHVEDEICPEPRIFGVEDDATGQPVAVSRSANNGDPVPVTFHLYGRGFAPITCSPFFSEWPPCSGPSVRIGRVFNGVFVPDTRFQILSRTWHWTDHVEVVATVDSDVEVGSYAIFIDNPETGTHTCVTQEVDGEDVPCFSVVD